MDPEASRVAATEFAGLRVVEVDTTISCARKHGDDNSMGLWTGLDTQKGIIYGTPFKTLRNTWSGRVDIQLEHLGYVAVKSGPGYSRASYILVNGN